jgi:hypothetical protein
MKTISIQLLRSIEANKQLFYGRQKLPASIIHHPTYRSPEFKPNIEILFSVNQMIK